MDQEATGRFTFPAYTLVNTSVFLERDKYRFAVRMNNLTNSEYFAGQGVIVAQMPRNFAVQLSLRF
ncbi:hypothetical protein [Sphingobacterium sp. WOUb80]|uniref:hypothetical protein n=1 Tax=Sphingobacterium sp. WOUb80 TaxID=3234028 RepID=UPI003CF24A9A